MTAAEREKAKRKIRKESGLCLTCGWPAERSYCRDCLDKKRAKAKERRIAGLCRGCGGSTNGKSRCDKCVKINRDSVLRLRDLVFVAYGGPVCSCCGEDIVEFLTIDHIENDGASHRRKIGQTSLYRWLKKNHFPSGYQVLCMNCNWGKHICGGICPHKLEKYNGKRHQGTV